MSLTTDELIIIGTIVAPQGLQGELRVKTDSDFPERFEQPGLRWLQTNPQQAPQPIKLLKGRSVPGKNLYIIRLEGIDNRNQAEALRGATLFVEKGDRPELEEDEYHVSDLIGLEVYHQETGENIGIVVNIFSAGNDVLEVQLHKQPEPLPEKKLPDLSKISRVSKRKKIKVKKPKPVTVLIPFVMEIVPVVDLESKRIEINPPQGLLNLDSVEASD